MFTDHRKKSVKKKDILNKKTTKYYLHMYFKQSKVQPIFRINAHIREEHTKKELDFYLR